MNRYASLFAVPLALATLAFVTPGGGVRADDPPTDPAADPATEPSTEPQTREFSDHNFKWTIPAKWEFVEPPETDKTAGFVITAKRVIDASHEMTAFMLVKDATNLTVEQAFATVKENKLKSLTETSFEDKRVNWSGAAGARRMKITGKAANKSQVAWFTYGGIVKDKYHQLDLRSSNGAYNDLTDEIAEIVKGCEFLEGAQADEELPPEPAAPSGDVRTFRFTKLNMTWTLPETVTAPEGVDAKQATAPMKLDADASLKGEFGRVQLQVDSAVLGAVILVIEPAGVGATPAGYLQNEGNFKSDKDQMAGTATPEIDESITIGNVPGGMRGTWGKSKEDGRQLLIRRYYAVIDDALFMVVVVAHDDAQKTYKEWFKGVLGGIAWDNASSGVRGPWVTPFPTYTSARKDAIDAKKKAPFTHSTLTLTKGEKFARLKYTPTDQPFAAWVFAAEARDTDAYCFIGIEKFDGAEMQRQKQEPDTLIDDHENAWKNEFDDPVTRVKDKNRKPETFRGAKGSSYEFKGSKEKHPWIERGYVVKSSQTVFRIRVMYGGGAAEAKLKADAEKLLGSIKFS